MIYSHLGLSCFHLMVLLSAIIVFVSWYLYHLLHNLPNFFYLFGVFIPPIWMNYGGIYIKSLLQDFYRILYIIHIACPVIILYMKKYFKVVIWYVYIMMTLVWYIVKMWWWQIDENTTLLWNCVHTWIFVFQTEQNMTFYIIYGFTYTHRTQKMQLGDL